MIRDEVRRLVELGRMPPGDTADVDAAEVERWQRALEQLPDPLTDEEACALARLFPKRGGCFGLEWTLIHAIETAPGWPIAACMDDDAEMVESLRAGAENAGRWGAAS